MAKFSISSVVVKLEIIPIYFICLNIKIKSELRSYFSL